MITRRSFTLAYWIKEEQKCFSFFMDKFVAVLVVIVLAIVILFINDEPPKPQVVANGKTISTLQSTYCWKKILNNECGDMILPTDQIAKKKVKPTIVASNSAIQIQYKKQLKSPIEVSIWDEKSESKTVEMHDGIFKAPKQKGRYIYSVAGHWAKGSSTAIFMIEVRD